MESDKAFVMISILFNGMLVGMIAFFQQITLITNHDLLAWKEQKREWIEKLNQ